MNAFTLPIVDQITFELKQTTNRILLHIDQAITLNRTVRLEDTTGLVYNIVHSYFDERVDLYQVQTSPSSQLPLGTYKLSISFMSETQLDGFFKSNYVEFGTTR